MIDRIVVVFGEERRTFALDIGSRLASILALAYRQDQDERVMETLVAGAGFEPGFARSACCVRPLDGRAGAEPSGT